MYRQLTPKSAFSSYKHGSRSSQSDCIPQKDMEVLPFMLPQLCSPLGEMLAPSVQKSAAHWILQQSESPWSDWEQQDLRATPGCATRAITTLWSPGHEERQL